MVADEGHSAVGQLSRPSMTPVKMPHVNVGQHFAAFSSRLVAYKDNHARPNLAYYARMREPMHLFPLGNQLSFTHVGYMMQFGWRGEHREARGRERRA